MAIAERAGIRSFWPDNTADKLYIPDYAGGIGGAELWKKIQEKWPGITMEELYIASEHIHTDHLTYDLYDSSDYTNFLCITALKEYFDRTRKH